MISSTQYLEAAKVEELASQYKTRGYQVFMDQPSSGGNARYDLIVEKDGHRIAVEVKARSTLKSSAHEIRELREKAIQEGFDEFRLVIVNPPRERSIEVEGIEEILEEHIIEEHFSELADLSSGTSVDGVTDVDIESIEVAKNGLDIRGVASVDVTLEYGGGSERDGMSWGTSFPFTFYVLLNNDMKIEESEINIDVSEFSE